MALRALARVNLAAIERNVSLLRGRLTGGAELFAVVKGAGYGHGAVPAALAARAGGAAGLAVATAGEAAELREGGVDGPILVMGALSSEELPVALQARADVVAWSEPFVAEIARAAGEPARVHVKLDTGMGRLGTRSVDEAWRVVDQVVAARPQLELAGAMTHFATADDDREFLAVQLDRFSPFAAELRRRFPQITIHAANSAATLRAPDSHFDMVRCGIAIYGCDPMNDDPAKHGLEPALELSSYVAAVKLARRGESAGYGRRFIADGDTWLATLPVGYADGIRRALSNNCDVLIGGRRYPLVGTVSMDNVTVDLGAGKPVVRPGDRAVLIGADGGVRTDGADGGDGDGGGGDGDGSDGDGGERQTAEDLARRIGTISYEIVCGISKRVPRAYRRDGARIVE
jgi:alanine racemase